MSSDTQKVVADMSRSVHRDCSLSVPVCPTVPAYVLTRKTSDREVGRAPLFPEIIRVSFLVVLGLVRSCFYLKERFTLEPTNMIQLSMCYTQSIAKQHLNVHAHLRVFSLKLVGDAPIPIASPKGGAIHPLLERPDTYTQISNLGNPPMVMRRRDISQKKECHTQLLSVTALHRLFYPNN